MTVPVSRKSHRVAQLREVLADGLPHQTYAAHEHRLHDLVLSKLSGSSSGQEVVFFLGPSRVGKTHLLESLNLQFGGVSQTPSGQRRGLLYVRVPVGGTEGALISAALRAIGEPARGKKSLDILRHRLHVRLLSLGVAVVIFDEIQHSVDEGRKTAVRAASDFLKGLIDDNPTVTFILVGLPIASQLRDRNPQLSGRSQRPNYFLPYNWESIEEREEFGHVAAAVYQCVVSAMDDPNLDLLRFIESCYLLSGGCFGIVITFLKNIINAFEQDSAAEFVSTEHLAAAFTRTSRELEYLMNPFESQEPIPEEMLTRMWGVVMHENHLDAFVSASTSLQVQS